MKYLTDNEGNRYELYHPEVKGSQAGVVHGYYALKPIAPVVEDRQHEYQLSFLDITENSNIEADKHWHYKFTPEAATAVAKLLKEVLAQVTMTREEWSDSVQLDDLIVEVRKAVQQGGDV